MQRRRSSPHVRSSKRRGIGRKAGATLSNNGCSSSWRGSALSRNTLSRAEARMEPRTQRNEDGSRGGAEPVGLGHKRRHRVGFVLVPSRPATHEPPDTIVIAHPGRPRGTFLLGTSRKAGGNTWSAPVVTRRTLPATCQPSRGDNQWRCRHPPVCLKSALQTVLSLLFHGAI